MSRGVRDRARHPNRKVDRESWIGQKVTLPETGEFTVTEQDKRYVQGATSTSGRHIDRTGIGLLTREKLG